MSEAVYLEKVKVFLTQELPQPYNKFLTVKNAVIVISIPEGTTFNDGYAIVHPAIEASVQRIRSREYDLNFTVWTPNQTRDFRVFR